MDKFLLGGKLVTGKIILGGRFVLESISHATPGLEDNYHLNDRTLNIFI